MAREVLGVSSLSTPEEIRAAFCEAVKRAHPDSGGDEAAFLQIVAAYERLQDPQVEASPAPAAAPGDAAPVTLEISPTVALEGGRVEHRGAQGRALRIKVPPGLRTGDKIRAGGFTFSIYVRAAEGVLVRGDDLWITVKVADATLRKGGRLWLETPLGRRQVTVDAKAIERGLVRLEGQGLPARGPHARGHLFLRLAVETARADSPALALLRRFTSAWA
ncbi:MAG: DnaJ C-terminal domain-containing protein [Longimicrobiaceae bacterium]